MGSILTFFDNQNSDFFSPTNLGNLQLWLDANDSSTITKDGANKVSQWDDKSGNDYHSTQLTASAQPEWTDNILNNKAILAFNGANYLIMNPGIYPIPSADNTLFIVAKTDNDTSAQRAIYLGAGGSTKYGLIFNSTSERVDFVHGGAAIATGVTKTNYNLYTGFRSGNDLSLTVGLGVENTSNTAISNSSVNEAVIGSYRFGVLDILSGGIAEIIIYNRALSPEERTQVQNYLSGKWGV